MNLIQQKIGIIGGGQLGKMMILEAKKLNFHIIILDPTPNCPAHSVADDHIVSEFDDVDAIRKLAERTDILTYEFEHIGVGTLIELEEEGFKIYPTARSLMIIQNKSTQKQVLVDNNIPVPTFSKIKTVQDIVLFGEKYGFPLLLKSCYGGYDGKGNFVVNNKDEIETGFDKLNGNNNKLMVEEFVNYRCEISIISARDQQGRTINFPIAENLHKDNILDKTTVPAKINSEETKLANKIANQVLQVFNGIGIFCIEMFVTKDHQVLVNEIAPRPHNSGHYTIEACVTSQFEQHIRAISGLPLGETRLLQKAVMKNLIGDRGPQTALYTGINEAMKIEGVNLHIYGKEIVTPGRKMGHITTIGEDLADVEQKSDKASELIRFIEE